MRLIQIFTNGLVLCTGLIISIGPQNAELLRTGFLQENVLLLATTYFICDVFLIFSGALGLGKFIPPPLVSFFAFIAIFLLMSMALGAFRRAYKNISNIANNFASRRPTEGKIKLIIRGLGLSLFNPMALLETIVILGGASLNYPQREKIIFSLGAVSASALWFYGLAYASKKFSIFFQSARQQRLLEFLVGCLLFFSATYILAKFFI